jgi:hypothetical protein
MKTHRLPLRLLFKTSIVVFPKMEVTFEVWLVITGRGGEVPQSMLFVPQVCRCVLLMFLVTV